MGWGKLQEMPTLFAERLISAKKGDVVGPIRSGVGFHILKVNDMRGGNQIDFSHRSTCPSYFAEAFCGDD